MANLDFLDELARHLIVQVDSLTEGQNIFVNQLPQSPNDCVTLWGLIGTTVQAQRDVPGLQFPRFQLLVRAGDYNEAADLFQACRTALHGMIGVNLPAGFDPEEDPYIRVMRCHVETEGGPIGRDDQGRSEFTCNFLAEYHHVAAPTPEP